MYLGGKALVIIGSLFVCLANQALSEQQSHTPVSTPRALDIESDGDDSRLLGFTKLRWTATGDDGNIGRAAGYEMRYRVSNDGPIDSQADWDAATPVPNMPIPSMAGQGDSVIVRNLIPNSLYYFCIKAFDEAGNYSPLSNSPMIYIPVLGTPRITGDLDNSGNIDSRDLIELVNLLKGKNATEDMPSIADLNGSGHVDGLDVVFLRAYLTGMEASKKTTKSPDFPVVPGSGPANSVK